MTLNEFIEESLKLQQDGKGDYAMKWCYWSDEGNIDQPPIVFDEEQKKLYIGRR